MDDSENIEQNCVRGRARRSIASSKRGAAEHEIMLPQFTFSSRQFMPESQAFFAVNAEFQQIRNQGNNEHFRRRAAADFSRFGVQYQTEHGAGKLANTLVATGAVQDSRRNARMRL